METVFLVVTSVSLVLVVVLAAIAAHLLREERRRSDARVAALVSMSAHRDRDDYVPLSDFAAIPAATPDPANAFSAEYALPQTVDDALPADFATPTLFGSNGGGSSAGATSPWRARLAIIAPLALILAVGAIAFYPSDRDISGGTSASGANDVNTTQMPLELLSLRHTQQADGLTVTGLVQNPRTSAPVSKVFATAYLFATDGTFLASGRAPLDFTTLSPGDESPFVVTVPVKGEVARYRIGFRGADGRVIAHVDRRAGGTVARASEEQP